MLANDLTLDDADGTETVFRLRSQDVTGSNRINTSSTLSEPFTLQVRHTQQGNGADAIDRHLVGFDWVKLDSAGKPRKLTVNLTVAVPRASVITQQMVRDTVANCIDLISDGGFTTSGMAGTTVLDAILLGES